MTYTEETAEPEVQTRDQTVEYWKARLSEFNKWAETWVEQAKRAEKVYFQEDATSVVKPDENDRSRYNILFSNTETLKPAIYNRVPKVEVERIVRDETGGVGRTAAIILERNTQRQMTDYGLDSAAKALTLDYLLSGMGQSWVCYEQETGMEMAQQVVQGVDEYGMPAMQVVEVEQEVITHQCVRVDFVRWDDFAYSPSREWSQVWWVARRLYMGHEDIEELCGAEVAEKLEAIKEKDGETADVKGAKNRTEIWEIWNKRTKMRYFMCEDYPELIKVSPVMVDLKGFFPCPKPLLGIRLTKDFLPKPEYEFYKALAGRLNQVMKAINDILPAVAIRGTYDKSVTELANIFSKPGFSNLVPVDNFAGLRDKGGLKGSMDLVDISVYVQALQQLFAAKGQLTQMIYEITGIGDIIRGQGAASETATAQQIKGQWAALRIRTRQADMQEHIKEVVSIAGEMVAELFTDEKLLATAGDLGDDANNAQAALQLLRDDTARNYRITIETDSTLEPDDAEEKARRTEFLGAVTSFMQAAGAILQQSPDAAQMLGEMLKFGVRGFRAGRQLEQSIDTYVAQVEQRMQQQMMMQQAQAQQQAMMAAAAPQLPVQQSGAVPNEQQGIPGNLPPGAGIGL